MEIWGEKRLADILAVVREQAQQSWTRRKAREAAGKPRGGASITVELVEHDGRLAEVWANRRERIS